MNPQKTAKETTMIFNLGLLFFSILATWKAEIYTCIFAATIAANLFVVAPLSILLDSKTQQNIDQKLQPWILLKRKPPDKLNPSWSFKRK